MSLSSVKRNTLRVLAAAGLFIYPMGLGLTAQAAEITLEVTTDDSATYIVYNGQTEVGDLKKLTEIYEIAKHGDPDGREFTNFIIVNGPGGNAAEGADLAEFINENELETLVVRDCMSACSLMWMAGKERWITEEGTVGFHFAYSSDSRFFTNLKETNGWVGIQDHVAKSSHYYTSQIFKYGVEQPYEFLLRLSYYGSAGTFFEITQDNLEYVGGRKWEDRDKEEESQE